MMYEPTPSKLADWLVEAKQYHRRFEKSHGSDVHWEKWWGLYMHYRMEGLLAETAYGFTTTDLLTRPAVK